MHKRWILFLASLFLVLPLTVRAADPLVDVAWVKANGANPNVRLVDTRGQWEFLNGHIPGSVYTDYGGQRGWRVKKNGVNGLLPEIPYLESLIGGLGIDNATHVVLVPGGYGAGEMAAAARIYWTFKLLGHDDISILDGGIIAYAKARYPMIKGPARIEAKTFKAQFRPRYIAYAKDIKAALKDRTPLLDTRPSDQFLGVNKSGSVKIPGTLPGAVSVPGPWLTVNNKGTFRKPEAIRKLYQAAGAPTTGKAIVFCNTGNWSSLGWFVHSELLGNKDATMYDGSLADWTQDPNNPVERKIEAN